MEQSIKKDPLESGLTSWIRYTGYMMPQEYKVLKDGLKWGFIAEQVEGFIPFSLKSAFLQKRRPSHFIVKNHRGEVLFHIYKPFYFLFSRLIVRGTRGELLGRVCRQFSITHKKYQLFSQRAGKPFALIKSFLTQFWTFPVQDFNGKKLGQIEKKWSGTAKEFLTYADTFTVQWKNLSLNQKIIFFCSVISIDFDHFEDHE